MWSGLRPQHLQRSYIHRNRSKYRLGYELEPFSSPPIFAYDVNGSKVFETRLSIAGALELYIKSMAASRDGGRFAASGLAVNLNTRTPFIAFLDRTGQVTRLIRPD